MIGKKDPTVEELVEIARSESTAIGSDRLKLTEIEQFIRDLNVEADPESLVEGQHIYWVYRTWCRDVGKRPKNNYVFFGQFAKHFTRSNAKHGDKCYLVKREPFVLSEQEWWDMKKFYRASRDIKRKRKEKKAEQKKRRESGSKETV